MSAIIDKAEKAIFAAMPTKVGIGPGVIAILIEIAMQLISNCASPAAAKKMIVDRPTIARILIRREMRRSGLIGKPNADEMVEALMTAGATMTDDQAAELVNFAA